MKVKIYFSGDVVYDMEKVDVILSGIAIERQDGYGDDAVYLPKLFKPQIELIREEQIITEEKETISVLKKKLDEAKKEKEKEWLKAYNAENKTKELSKELEILKGVCPHKENEEIKKEQPNERNDF